MSPVERERVEAAPEQGSQLTAAGPAGLQARALQLAGQLGNAAFSRIVRVQVVARQQAPAQATPRRQSDDARMRELVQRILTDVVTAGGNQLDFLSQLRTEIGNEFHGPEVPAAQARVGSLMSVSGMLDGRTTDYVAASRVLSRIVGTSVIQTGVGFTGSLGHELFVRKIAEDAGNYLAAPMTGEDFWMQVTPDFLSSNFGHLLSRVKDPEGLLEMEIEGSLDLLISGRADLASSVTAVGRSLAGQAIARVSRRILLADQALRQLRAGTAPQLAAGGAGSLEDKLRGFTARINQIRAQEGTEKSTIAQLGDDVDLLRPQQINLQNALSSRGPEGVVPEEALPEATDRASERLLGELGNRVAGQARQVMVLHEQVIPSRPTYDLAEFAAVLRRWSAFMSPAGRDADPLWRQTVKLYDELMEAMSHAGTEGGIGRAMLQPVMNEAINKALHGPSADFAQQITAAGPQREDRGAGGSATSPQHRYAERFKAGAAGGVDAQGEVESREAVVQTRARDTPSTFRQAQKQQAKGQVDAGGPIVFASDDARRGWSYLVETVDPQDSRTREERSMNPEVARLLLARTQQLRTLEADHMPGIGEEAVRTQGTEAARGTAQQTLLQGERAGIAVNPRIEAQQGRLADARRAGGGGSSGPLAPSAEQRAVEGVIREIEAYLDGYFAAQTEPVMRIAGVLQIAQVEYAITGRFWHELTPAALAKAIGLAAAIAGASAVLRRLGSIGAAAAQALNELMHHAGTTNAAAAVNIMAFVQQAGQADGFRQARVKAFFARSVATDLGQMIQGSIAGGVLAGAGAALRLRGEPRTVGEAMDALKPILVDPAAKRTFRQQVETSLAQRREQQQQNATPDAEAERLQAMLDHLDGRTVPGRRPPNEVPLEGAAPPDARTASGTTRDTPPPPGPKPNATAPPAPGTPEWLRLQHEGWTQQMLAFRARPPALPRAVAGEPITRAGSIGNYRTAAEAYRAYENAIGRAPGREVGVFRHTRTGEYEVMVGTADYVSEPHGDGPWEGVVHFHVNPANILTFRMPAPRDVQLAAITAIRSGSRVTEFVEFQVPGGGRQRTAYTAEADGRITVQWVRPDGRVEPETFATLEAYAARYDSRTRFVDPSSPEYQFMMADLADYYASRDSGRTQGGSARTTSGSAHPAQVEAENWLRTQRDSLTPELQAAWDSWRGPRDSVAFRREMEPLVASGNLRRALQARGQREAARPALEAAMAAFAAGSTGRVSDTARRLVQQRFFERPDVQQESRSPNPDRPWMRAEMANHLAAGEARARSGAGAQVLTNIHLVRDTGHSTMEEWRRANDALPEKERQPEASVYPAGGRVWVRIGEIDVLVLQPGAGRNGRAAVREMIEVKSGTTESGADAQRQIDAVRDRMRDRSDDFGTIYQLHDRRRDITNTIDPFTARITSTRGPAREPDDRRAPFAGDVGATTPELDQIVNEAVRANQPSAPGGGGGGGGGGG